MKRIGLLFLLVTSALFLFSQQDKDTVWIEDQAFLQALIEKGFDSNGDSLIDFSEAEAIRQLDISGKEIRKLTGIRAFTNLQSLNCSNNKIESLDLSNNARLTHLWCQGNELINLNVSSNIALVFLNCSFNALRNLDLTNTTLLELDIGFNPDLSEVCVRELPLPVYMKVNTKGSPNLIFTTECSEFPCLGQNCPNINFPDSSFQKALIDAGVDTNSDGMIHNTEAVMVSYLDVSGSGIMDMKGLEAFINLDTLVCDSNFLTTLDLSYNTSLKYLDCGQNLITYLDVRSCPALSYLNCDGNNLSGLDISKNLDLRFIGLNEMPGLEQVCVWTSDFPPRGVDIDTSASPNVIFKMHCLHETVYIPDRIFLNKLILSEVDTNMDRLISYGEALAVDTLSIPYHWGRGRIQSLAGIEVFENLVSLDCGGHDLQSLDVSSNIKLKVLSCGNNKFDSLNVSDLANLEVLYCENNDLENLDILNTAALKELNCSGNQLTNLDISQCTSLRILNCSENLLTSLDLSNLFELREFQCAYNDLKKLDLSGNALLHLLNCSNNLLTYLDISFNRIINRLSINGMPSLTRVCYWSFLYPEENVISSEGSPNVVFLPECGDTLANNLSVNLYWGDGTYFIDPVRMDSTLVLPALEFYISTGESSRKWITIYNEGPDPYVFKTSVDYSTLKDPQNLAIRFDGVNDFLFLSRYGELGIGGELTIEAWIKYEQGGSGPHTIISRRLGNEGYEMSLTGEDIDKRLEFKVGNDHIRSLTNLLPDKWYHVAATSGNTTRLYINGILDTWKIAEGGRKGDFLDLLLGTNQPEADSRYFFKGTIEDVRIWNRERTAEEILDSRILMLEGNEPGLIGYWTFNNPDKEIITNHATGIRGIIVGATRLLSPILTSDLIEVPRDVTAIRGNSSYNLNIGFNKVNLEPGVYHASVLVYSNFSSEPDIKIPVYLEVLSTPSFTVHPESVEFGEIEVYKRHEIEIKVMNPGSESLIIDSAKTDLLGSELDHFSDQVEPGEKKVFILSHYERDLGPFEGTVTFYTNDPKRDKIVIPVTGEGVRSSFLHLMNPQVVKMYPGSTRTLSISYSNWSTQFDMILQCNIFTSPSSNKSQQIFPGPASKSWLTTKMPEFDTLAPGETKWYDFMVDTRRLEYGTYFADIVIEARNPMHEVKVFPVTLLVLPVAVEEYENQNLKVYPNPANRAITIESAAGDKFSFSLSTLDGRKIHHSESHEHSLQYDLSHLPAGIYLITVKSKDSVLTRRIVKH